MVLVLVVVVVVVGGGDSRESVDAADKLNVLGLGLPLLDEEDDEAGNQWRRAKKN
jgi:hypothetical protein